jgi:hypothetical protein
MREIYTGDLCNIVIKYSDKISFETSNNGSQDSYIIENECYNLKNELLNTLVTRFSEAFEELVNDDFILVTQKEELRNRL